MRFGGQTMLPTDERTKIAVRCEAKAFGCCAKAAVAVAVSAPQVSDDLGELQNDIINATVPGQVPVLSEAKYSGVERNKMS